MTDILIGVLLAYLFSGAILNVLRILDLLIEARRDASA